MNLARIITEINHGNLVITPTDTVYGILADATNLDAVKKVFNCKNRNQNKALLITVSDIEMLQYYTQSLNSLEETLIEQYFPGKLTMLLPKNSYIDDIVTGGRPLVGIRIPDDPDLTQIIQTVGKPLISTSVNLSGEQAITNPSQIHPKILKNIAYIEDQGTIKNQPSSIIKVDDGKIVILRDGDIAQHISETYRNIVHYS